ncbi:DUF4221 family protein [Algoriphagus winogradskyi]|uniref:Phytase-like domain-containing protein n=1 Tax=Algoriphagus winogradskyi TaxID=237017 RepID=A0ABY1PI29_9BACT|nr:DUF4221 family protein [Algoriphagus winogradskyi]SMP34130.1 protein of unknown function [Algoriphagus winogradskyi]
MRKNPFILFLLFGSLSLLVSCGSESDNITTPQELVSDGQLVSLPIDSQTSNVSAGLVPFQDENNLWLFNVNHTNNEIQLYDLESKKMEKRMVFDVEGSEGVGFIQGIHVESLDSIFLFDFPSKNLHLVDTSGAVLFKIKYEPPVGHSPAFIHNAHFITDPILSGNQLLVKTRPEVELAKVKREDLIDKKLTYSIDLKSGAARLSAMRYPEDYLSEGVKQLDFSMARAGDKLVYSFISDHKLYVSDLKGNPKDTVQAKSQFLTAGFETLSDVTNRIATQKFLYASDRYERLLYDEYRGVFYRFVFPKIEVQNIEEINQLRRFPRKFSVMILDKDLNVLGETLMPDNTYFPANSFVSKDGLLISISHPDNPANEEDLMSFEVFKLKEVE